MTGMDYAEDLAVLWTQYKRDAEDRPNHAAATLKCIVAHCEVAMADPQVGPAEKTNYFGFHKARAESLLKGA